ncbi:MAG TPA: FtsX-like permease family protein, partial [Phycisphaerae bacterium]|nr:FtsX-like permease family protein [Phycisphaerae bacterium]
EDPINKAIQVDKDFYVVVGVTHERQASGNIGGSFTGQDYNKDVYIPLETLRARIGDQVMTSKAGSREGEIVQLSQLTVTVGDISEVEETAAVIKLLLKKFHKQEDYSIIVPKELLRQAEILQKMFGFLSVVIAGISLLVGGIGIMNIMLVTVTERTREIGTRKAIGAKNRDILTQFLIEAMAMSGLGGALGAAAGIGLAKLIPMIPMFSTFMTIVQPTVVVVAILFAAVVGIFFGLYPAYRAGQLDPIEALRYE